MPRRHLGFTLLEIIIVIVVIAMMAGVAIGAGRHAIDTGRRAQARAELAAISSALEDYRRRCGDYPRTHECHRLVQSLLGRAAPDGSDAAMPQLLELSRLQLSADPFFDPGAVLLDPWSFAYRYVYRSQEPWTNPRYVLYSAGPDGDDHPFLIQGGFPDRTAAANRDNIHASDP
jgi:prepilin-type N-terminal cleavage/methylation domain-containing protein